MTNRMSILDVDGGIKAMKIGSRDRPLTSPEVAQQFPEVLIFDARYVRSADRRMTRR